MGDKKIKELMLQQEKQLSILSRVTQRINEHLEIHTILRTLVEAALELTRSKEGTAGLFIDGQMVFKEYFTQGQWIPVDYSFPPGYGVPGWVLENKESYISNDTANDPAVIQEIREKLGFYNLADTPILDRDGNLLGCFEIHNTLDSRPYDERDIALLKGLSASAAIAMENARIVENLHKTQLQLRQSETYLQSLFEETPVSLCEEDFSAVKNLLDEMTNQGVKDLGRHLREHPELVAKCAGQIQVTRINKATMELFEANNKDELLTSPNLIFTEENLEVFGEKLICLATGDDKTRVQGTRRTLTGKEIEVLVNWSVLPGYEESWEKIIVSMIDVTREREIDRMKNEFVSIAAHELRTPLATLLGYTELVQMKEFDQLGKKMKQECLDNIHNQGMSLEQLIDDLLDVGRIESGRCMQIQKSHVKFPEFLVKICKNHQHETTKHSIQMDLPDHDMWILIDPGRMTQVLDNLLSNAIKYSPVGGVIKVTGKILSNSLSVSISDSGVGMTEQQCQRIFDKFYRADTSNTAVRGLGLGMNIAKSIIEAHGGTIRVESIEQKGTMVHFTIPVESP
jgi:signal transduction histidine kinase